jgi:hypothetical protein
MARPELDRPDAYQDFDSLLRRHWGSMGSMGYGGYGIILGMLGWDTGDLMV